MPKTRERARPPRMADVVLWLQAAANRLLEQAVEALVVIIPHRSVPTWAQESTAASRSWSWRVTCRRRR